MASQCSCEHPLIGKNNVAINKKSKPNTSNYWNIGSIPQVHFDKLEGVKIQYDWGPNG